MVLNKIEFVFVVFLKKFKFKLLNVLKMDLGSKIGWVVFGLVFWNVFWKGFIVFIRVMFLSVFF